MPCAVRRPLRQAQKCGGRLEVARVRLGAGPGRGGMGAGNGTAAGPAVVGRAAGSALPGHRRFGARAPAASARPAAPPAVLAEDAVAAGCA